MNGMSKATKVKKDSAPPLQRRRHPVLARRVKGEEGTDGNVDRLFHRVGQKALGGRSVRNVVQVQVG